MAVVHIGLVVYELPVAAYNPRIVGTEEAGRVEDFGAVEIEADSAAVGPTVVDSHDVVIVVPMVVVVAVEASIAGRTVIVGKDSVAVAFDDRRTVAAEIVAVVDWIH